MIKLSKQVIDNGNKVLIKIKGDNRKEIVRYFWLFVNRGCVKFKPVDDNDIKEDTGFNWLVDDLEGYFRTNQTEFIEALQSISLFRLLRETDPDNNLDNIPRRLEKESKVLGLQWFNDIPDENVLRPDNVLEYISVE